MNHWGFVTAAYAVVALGSGGVALLSWLAMRRAEAKAEGLKRS